MANYPNYYEGLGNYNSGGLYDVTTSANTSSLNLAYIGYDGGQLQQNALQLQLLQQLAAQVPTPTPVIDDEFSWLRKRVEETCWKN